MQLQNIRQTHHRSNTQQPLGIRKVQRNTDKLEMVQQDLGL